MKTKDLKRKQKAQPGGSLEPVGEFTISTLVRHISSTQQGLSHGKGR
jgi:hypothetical protein